MAVAERLPDGGAELCGPAKQAGEEDRPGQEAERARSEEGLTGVEGNPHARRPHDIAEHLVQEHGIDHALEPATEGITTMQDQGDN